MNLSYLRDRLLEIGVPEDVSSYLHKLNQSIVRLTDRDEMDEGLHRLALFNSDGSLNPNLPSEMLADLKGLSPSD